MSEGRRGVRGRRERGREEVKDGGRYLEVSRICPVLGSVACMSPFLSTQEWWRHWHRRSPQDGIF